MNGRFRGKLLLPFLSMSLLSPLATAAGGNAITGIEAESYDMAQGVENNGPSVGSFDAGDYLAYQQVNFGNGVDRFEAVVAVTAAYAGGKIEVRLDGVTGPKVGELTVQSTGDWSTFKPQSVALTQVVSGTRNLYLVARGGWGLQTSTSSVLPLYLRLPAEIPMPA